MGRSLRLGDEAGRPSRRRSRGAPTLPHGDLGRDPLILRTLAEQNRLSPALRRLRLRGSGRRLEAPDTVAVDDPVSLGAPL